jgi:hypothetical protein
MASFGYIGGSYDKRKKHEKGKEEGEGRERRKDRKEGVPTIILTKPAEVPEPTLAYI